MRIENFLWFLSNSNDPEDLRQFCVLYWKARGLTHKEIATRFSYSEEWVQRYMTRTYAQFGMTDWKQTEKEAWIERELYPVIRKLMDDRPDILKLLPPAPVGRPPGSPPPPPIINGKTVSGGGPSTALNPQTRALNSGSPRNIFLFMGFIVLLAVFYWLGQHKPISPLPPPITQVVTQILPTSIPSPVPSPVPSELPTVYLYPTATEAPTATSSPTIAPLVVPTNGVLFQDNFNSGISPEWQGGGSDWLVSEGALTLSTKDAFNNQYNWISLDHPEWKNYTLSLDYMQNVPQRSSMGDAIIAIHISQEEPVGVEIDENGNVYFVQMSSDLQSATPLAGQNFDYTFPSNFESVEITVKGNNYTLKVGGRKIQSVSIAGAGSGGISLGIECNYFAQCPAFDNVKVTYLP